MDGLWKIKIFVTVFQARGKAVITEFESQWENMPLILSHFQHSEETIDGLKVGTMLKHKEYDYEFDGDFFSKSQVF